MTVNLAASKAYNERARQRIAGAVNSNARFGIEEPRCFARGSGPTLLDVDGNRYVDYVLGMGTVILGHANPVVTEAVVKAAEMGQCFASQHPLELELAEIVHERMPAAELMRFGGSGSEMVQVAIRLARAFTGRNRIVKFEGHYHGWMDNVLLNLSGPPQEAAGALPFPLYIQSEGQSPAAIADTHVLPWNDIDALSKYVSVHGEQVAAVIMEPVMGNVGVIEPKAGYLHAVKDYCARYGIVFILDEVITGFRLSRGGAQEQFKIDADLVIGAKAMGNGFPLSVLGGRSDIMSMIGTGRVNHSGTNNANVMSVAAGIATLNELAADAGAAYRRIERAGTSLMEGIRDVAARRATNLKVIGYPSVFHTFFTDSPETTDYFSYCQSNAERLKKLIIALNAEGVRVSSRGTWFVSAAHTEEEIDLTLIAVDRVLSRALRRD